MRRERSKPSYSLDSVKHMARDGSFNVMGRASRFITNRIGPGSVKRVVREIVEAAQESDFVKSMELDSIPGTWADVYMVPYDDETWYLKFFVREDQTTCLVVMSANWDGYIH